MAEKEALLLKYIEDYVTAGNLPMHMPGHKRNDALAPYLKKLGAAYDMTEIAGFDNLHGAEDILLESMKRASRLWGSEETLFLVNGSSCGVLAAVSIAVKRGEKILVSRNCHMSVYNALELCGAEPVFIMPPADEEFEIYLSLTPSDVRRALQQNPDIRAVMLTSPTYEGVISDIAGICEAAHMRGVPVLVDEAHGSHLGFCDFFTGGAVSAGADIVIQSLHKTLPSLTQTAVAHIGGTLINRAEFKRRLSIFETSSPSYLLLSSIDGCVGLIKERGAELFKAWEQNIKDFEEKTASLKNLKIFMREKSCLHNEGVFKYDRSKILISSRGTALTGAGLMEVLRSRFHIELEMASGDSSLAMTGVVDTKESLSRLAEALLIIDTECKGEVQSRGSLIAVKLPESCCSIETALRSEKTVVCAAEATGRISAEYVWAYPPGVPLLIPGEAITGDFIESVRAFSGLGTALKSTSGGAPSMFCVIA